MSNLNEAVEETLNYIRKAVSSASGTEEEVLGAFGDAIGSEIDGWDMRLQEINDEGAF